MTLNFIYKNIFTSPSLLIYVVKHSTFKYIIQKRGGVRGGEGLGVRIPIIMVYYFVTLSV